MAKKPNAQRAQTQSDFANHNADAENLEKIERSRAAENAKAGVGHNSGEPSDEVIERHFNALLVSKLEIEAAARIMQKARAEYGAARKTAKTDLGSKSWVDDIVDAIDDFRQAEKGGTGEIVTRHRRKGRVFKIMNVPLYHQHDLFKAPEATTVVDGIKIATPATAYLLGEQAYRDEAPADSNPFTPGSEQFVSWANGYADRRQAALDGVGLGNDGGTSNGITDGAAAH